jgi:hypothetical protein
MTFIAGVTKYKTFIYQNIEKKAVLELTVVNSEPTNQLQQLPNMVGSCRTSHIQSWVLDWEVEQHGMGQRSVLKE